MGTKYPSESTGTPEIRALQTKQIPGNYEDLLEITQH